MQAINVGVLHSLEVVQGRTVCQMKATGQARGLGRVEAEPRKPILLLDHLTHRCRSFNQIDADRPDQSRWQFVRVLAGGGHKSSCIAEQEVQA